MSLGVRLLALDGQPLWWDEGYSFYFATESTFRLLELTSLDIHPPLYYLLLQGWLALVGSGALQARLLSVFLGLLALPLLWIVTRGWIGRRTATMVTLLLAFSPMHVYYSQEIRMYGLVTLLALLAVAAWQRRAWTLLGVAVGAGLLTHYYFLLLLVPLLLLILREVRKGLYPLRGPLQTLAIALILDLPWVLYSAIRLLRYVSGKLVVEADQPMTPLEFLPRHLIAWSVGHLPENWMWLAWGSIPFVGLALLGLWRIRAGQGAGITRGGAVALLWVLPILGTFLVNLVAPFDTARIERQLLFVLPFFLLLVAMGLSTVRYRMPALFLLLLVVLLVVELAGLAAFYTTPRYEREDYRPILSLVGAEQGPGDAWLAIYPWQIGYLRAYLPEHHPTPVMADIAWDGDDAGRVAALEGLLREHPRLWFPAYQVQGRLFEEKLAQSLNQSGVQAWNEWIGNTRLYLYGAAPPVSPLAPAGTVERVGSLSVALPESRVATGIGILPLYFQVETAVEGVRASLQLVGRDSVWGEWDDEVGAGVMRAGLPVAHGTPPGEYTVQLTLYDAESGRPLERFADGVRQAPEASVGAVTVERAPVPLPPAALRRLAATPRDDLFGGRIRLLGYTLPGGTWQQGDQVPLTLFWRAEQDLAVDMHHFVQVIDEGGEVHAARDLPPVNGTFPTSHWRADDLVRDPHLLQLPADLAPGEYRVITGIYVPNTGERLRVGSEEGGDFVTLGMLEVAGRERLMEEPRIGVPGDVAFGERVHLRRWQVPDALRPGDALELQLVWQASSTGGPPLRGFVHLYRDGEQLAVSDHVLDPPATAWIREEWIMDTHSLQLPETLPPGEYQLLAGLYDAESGARLPANGGDSAIIATWVVQSGDGS